MRCGVREGTARKRESPVRVRGRTCMGLPRLDCCCPETSTKQNLNAQTKVSKRCGSYCQRDMGKSLVPADPLLLKKPSTQFTNIGYHRRQAFVATPRRYTEEVNKTTLIGSNVEYTVPLTRQEPRSARGLSRQLHVCPVVPLSANRSMRPV